MNAAFAPTTSDVAPDVAATYDRVPQVNLLPAEVAAAHGLRAVKRWSLLGVAVVVLLIALVYAYSSMELAQARSDLTTAQDETARLTAEQAQYAEVPVVMAELGDVKTTREFATSAEVLWKPYLDQIRAALPEGGVLESLQVNGATPVTPAMPPMDVLQTQTVGQMTLTATTATVPNVVTWNDALGAVPGLVHARVQSVMQDSGDEGPGGYTVTMTIQYDDTALSGRFAPTEED